MERSNIDKDVAKSLNLKHNPTHKKERAGKGKSLKAKTAGYTKESVLQRTTQK